MKTTERGGPHCYDGAKKLSGRKRHLLVDTLGLVLGEAVHPTDLQDRAAAPGLLVAYRLSLPRLELIYVSSILLANSEMRPLCACMPAPVQGQMSPLSTRLPGVKLEFANSIELTLRDGTAAVGSRRFFDDDNVPPWDCWVLYVADPLTPEQRALDQARGRRVGRWSGPPPTPLQDDPRVAPPDEVLDSPSYVLDPVPPWRESYLVSWVAPPLIPLARSGVVVNPESCIEWLADWDTPFIRALQALRLLAWRTPALAGRRSRRRWT